MRVWRNLPVYLGVSLAAVLVATGSAGSRWSEAEELRRARERATGGVQGARADQNDRSDADLLGTLTFRNVGPWRMQSRASAIAVAESARARRTVRRRSISATWTGGVFKTTNGGVTFQGVFDQQNKLTIGAIAVAPSNADRVWVGTGETRGARSSYPGTGSTARPTRGRPGRTSGSATLTTSPASSSTLPIPTSFTSVPWGISIQRMPNEACSRRPMEARAGSASSF